MSEQHTAENDAPALGSLDRCTCTHLRTWHRAHDQSGNFVGVNRGACVVDDCGCDHFRSERDIPPAAWDDDPNHPEGVDCRGEPLSSGERCGRDQHAPYVLSPGSTEEGNDEGR